MIYLVQHGEAQAKEENPDRPLTERGEDRARALGDFLARAGIRVDAIHDSGKLRARQTAEILAESILPEGSVEDMAGIEATDPATPIQATIDNWEKDVMLVSHLPFVALLTAALTGASETHPPVAFTPGTAIALQPDGEGNWQIVWMIRPDLLP